MLSPNYLQHIADGSEEIASQLHTYIIRQIIDRMMIRIGRGDDYLLTSSDRWRIQILQDAGYMLEDITAELSKITKRQEKEIKAAMEEAGIKALEYDHKIYEAAGLSPIPLTQSPQLIRLMERNMDATMGEWENYTRTTAEAAQRLFINISTHSAREDGDSNTTQKNKQFFITFPQSNHIILPQITANLPCTHPKPFSLCSFSGANPPVNSCLLLVRTKLFETSLPPAARSEYQRLFHFNPFTHPNMVHLCSVFISQVVKSKAVSLLINDICQYGF